MKSQRKAGEKKDVTVCAPPGYWANNPQIIRTDKEIVLAYPLQMIDKLKTVETHHHNLPFAEFLWSVSSDGHDWWTTDRAPVVGPVRDCSYGQPLPEGGMVTMSFTRPFITPYAFIQKGKVGHVSYNNQLPHVEAVQLSDFGPHAHFYFFSMTRTSDGALLAGGYAQCPGSSNPMYMSAVFLRSENNGKSWKYFSHVEPISPAMSFAEPGLLSDKSGRVVCVLRSCMDWVPREERPPEGRVGYGYFLYQTESLDNGRTWSRPAQLPIWGHPPYMLRLKTGTIAMFYGHRRPPFSIRVVLSHDNGKTWDINSMRTVRTFEPGGYDMGYPHATQLDDGTIICAYYGYSSPEAAAKPQNITPRKVVDDQTSSIADCGIFVSIFDEEWLKK